MYKVLIVDDEVAVRKGMGILVDWNAYGFEVSSYACDGIEALELVKSSEYHLIITDIRMPGIDGIKLIRELKSMDYPAKVIILSGYQDFQYAQAAIEYGVKSYILKPVKEQRLIDALTNIKLEIESESHFREYRKIQENIFKNLIVEKDSESSKRKGNVNIKEIIRYVDEHYFEGISIQELSEMFFINPAYLGRLFKGATGLSLNDYVKKLKIEYAARLLKDTSSLVYEIAEIVGYKDINHFYKIFKELKKVSPSEYRQKYQK